MLHSRAPQGALFLYLEFKIGHAQHANNFSSKNSRANYKPEMNPQMTKGGLHRPRFYTTTKIL
jgi:hypothetical protein